MEFVKLENIISEIDYCKKEALENLVDVKVDNEVQGMFKKCFEEIVKSLIDINVDRLKHRIESHASHYESIESFAERLKLSEDRLKRALEAGDVESISIINMEQADKKTEDLVNFLKMGDE